VLTFQFFNHQVGSLDLVIDIELHQCLEMSKVVLLRFLYFRFRCLRGIRGLDWFDRFHLSLD